MYTDTCTYMYTYVYINIFISICIYIYIFICVCVCAVTHDKCEMTHTFSITCNYLHAPPSILTGM